MSNCEKYRPLLVGLLDRELDPQESAEVNEHLIRCSECREEYEKLRETSGKLESVAFEEPSDEVLRRMWRNPFNRLGRIGGISLIVAGYAALICYALFEFFTSGKENFWARVPVAAIVIGFLILLLLVMLERLKTYRKDPYREIER
jgi:hypothetical protein